ncbi:MAG: serine/threonine-protein kinase [Planctomycetota bacterium]|nr:serine/threonine-protein kinase [Planctomycetota bacterium]
MQFDTTDELTRELLRLRLVTDEQLVECQSRLPITSEPKSLLKALESQHLLTSYQVTKLSTDDDSPLVLGDYKLMYQNASGSFARVFRGCTIPDGKMIGLKVLRSRYLAEPQSVAHFHREAELCMKLRHKNIVPIYSVGTDGDYHYFTMEFIEGGNLRDFANIRGKFQSLDLLRCATDMAEGLEYALQQGMTHRDFKLSNVLMSSRGVAKLVDFGLAGDDATSNDENIQAVEYATLEKHTGAPVNDPRSDLFFLGAVLYELATGISPYPPTRSREDRRMFSRYSGIRPIRKADPKISSTIADIIDRLLKIVPLERYQSATELLVDLRAALKDFSDENSGDAEIRQAPRLSTILCVEYRVKQQDMLRDHLSKHGFRVLMLTAWDRALARIKSNPPDCLLLMGDAIGDDCNREVYDEALRWCKLQGVGCVVVASAEEEGVAQELQLTGSSRVLVQPITLRDVRSAIVDVLQSKMNRE